MTIFITSLPLPRIEGIPNARQIKLFQLFLQWCFPKKFHSTFSDRLFLVMLGVSSTEPTSAECADDYRDARFSQTARAVADIEKVPPLFPARVGTSAPAPLTCFRLRFILTPNGHS